MDRPSRQIDFYLDFTSPYAYLGSTQIEALAARHDCSLVWRPFLIGATFRVSGRKAPIQHPMLREYMFNDVLRTARLLQQPLNFPAQFPVLSVKAGRLFYHFQDRDGDQKVAKEFARAVFKAYFVDSQDISSNRVLVKSAAPFGLNENDVNKLVKSVELKERFRLEVDAAITRGVFGAPMFVVADEMFWGVDHLDQLDKWLETGGW